MQDMMDYSMSMNVLAIVLYEPLRNFLSCFLRVSSVFSVFPGFLLQIYARDVMDYSRRGALYDPAVPVLCWPLCIMPVYAISMLPLSSHYNQSKLIVETTIVSEDDKSHTQRQWSGGHCFVLVIIRLLW